jgi:hypothetical protein
VWTASTPPPHGRAGGESWGCLPSPYGTGHSLPRCGSTCDSMGCLPGDVGSCQPVGSGVMRATDVYQWTPNRSLVGPTRYTLPLRRLAADSGQSKPTDPPHCIPMRNPCGKEQSECLLTASTPPPHGMAGDEGCGFLTSPYGMGLAVAVDWATPGCGRMITRQRCRDVDRGGPPSCVGRMGLRASVAGEGTPSLSPGCSGP